MCMPPEKFTSEIKSENIAIEFNSGSGIISFLTSENTEYEIIF